MGSQREYEAAGRRLEVSRNDLESYREWRLREEERLFGKIKERSVGLHDVENLHFHINALRLEELNKQRLVAEAEIKLLEARQKLEAAQAAYRKAVQSRQKIEEHRRSWELWAKQQSEQLAEKELEEFLGTPFRGFQER